MRREKKIMLNFSPVADDHLERIPPAKKIPGRSPGMSSQIFEVFRELRKSPVFIAGGIRSLIILNRNAVYLNKCRIPCGRTPA